MQDLKHQVLTTNGKATGLLVDRTGTIFGLSVLFCISEPLKYQPELRTNMEKLNLAISSRLQNYLH